MKNWLDLDLLGFYSLLTRVQLKADKAVQRKTSQLHRQDSFGRVHCDPEPGLILRAQQLKSLQGADLDPRTHRGLQVRPDGPTDMRPELFRKADE